MIQRIVSNKFVQGSLLLLTSAYTAISLFSYSEDDPSFNTSSTFEPENYLSYAGSYYADLMMQFIGKSSWVFALSCLILSINVMRRDVNRIRLKVFSSFISVILLSFLVSLLAPSWSLPSHRYFLDILHHLNPSVTLMIEAVTAIIWLSLFTYGLGVSKEDLKSAFYSLAHSLIFFIPNLLRSKAGGVNPSISSYNSKAPPPIKTSTYFDRKKESADKGKTGLTAAISSGFGMFSSDSKQENHVPENRPRTNTHTNSNSHSSYGSRAKSNAGDFTLPYLDLLSNKRDSAQVQQSAAELQHQAERLISVLQDFGVKGNVIGINQGPVVTLYEFEPAAGTKSSRVISLADDIARSLAALSARISVIPGRNVLGIELPNESREYFRIRELIESKEYRDGHNKLPIILGKDIAGKPTVADLSKMPHLLVAGTTGSGKSVGINTMILSLLYKLSPKECRFIMIDPKMLELSVYDGIPHLLAPVVTEPGKAVVALKWAVREMENRYRLMSNLGVRNIFGYNERIRDAVSNGEVLKRTVQTGFDPETGKPINESVPMDMTELPFIVVIVDEMADLMLVAGKDIESSIQRLAQMARAAGIHLIMATQRPSVDVITGVIKANFPSRISFKVTSKIDSRTILGEQGSEQLLGMGDMLYMGNSARIIRVHGPFVEDMEVERISRFLKEQGEPDYVDAVTTSDDEDVDFDDLGGDSDDMSDDGLYKKAVQIVKRDKKASTSYVQRTLRIGYNRAAILIERMEREGILSAPNHSGKREILDED